MNWEQIYNGAFAADLLDEGISYLVIKQNPGLSGAANLYRWRIEVYALSESRSGFPIRDSSTKEVLGGAENLRAAKNMAETDYVLRRTTK